MEFKFSVTARCHKYSNNSIINDGNDWNHYDVEDIILDFDHDLALKFISRFVPPNLKINEYKVQFKCDNNYQVVGLVLHDKDNMYICTNWHQVANDVLKGFLQISTLDKIVDIMEFDFKAGIDLQTEVVDEFE